MILTLGEHDTSTFLFMELRGLHSASRDILTSPYPALILIPRILHHKLINQKTHLVYEIRFIIIISIHKKKKTNRNFREQKI